MSEDSLKKVTNITDHGDETLNENVPSIFDRWKVEPFKPEDNPNGMLEESEFSLLFPKYREQYFVKIWPFLTKKLSEYSLKATLNLVEGSITVSNTKTTWDPFIIIKARDLIKLLARSMPYDKAVSILDDEIFSEVIKVKNLSSNTARFIKRRARLIGKDGATLRVQGGTVTILGPYRGVKAVRKIVEDTFYNVHPIYNIKALMIKKELEKDEKLQHEDWTRFVPKFKSKRPVETYKPKKVKTKNKKEYTPFPPPPVESKIDKQLASGEYFMKNKEKKQLKEQERRLKQTETSEKKKAEKLKNYQGPTSRNQLLEAASAKTHNFDTINSNFSTIKKAAKRIRKLKNFPHS